MISSYHFLGTPAAAATAATTATTNCIYFQFALAAGCRLHE